MYGDEASVSIHAPVCSTYAPRGKRPVIPTNSEVGKRVYAASAISEQGDMFYRVRVKAFDAAAIIDFLRYILEKMAKKIILIWDNASIHDCEAMRQFLNAEPLAKNLFLAKFPPYSPELNPDEQVWHQVKNCGLRNSCYRNVNELSDKVDAELNRLANDYQLVKQFFKHPDVRFYA